MKVITVVNIQYTTKICSLCTIYIIWRLHTELEAYSFPSTHSISFQFFLNVTLNAAVEACRQLAQMTRWHSGRYCCCSCRRIVLHSNSDSGFSDWNAALSMCETQAWCLFSFDDCTCAWSFLFLMISLFSGNNRRQAQRKVTRRRGVSLCLHSCTLSLKRRNKASWLYSWYLCRYYQYQSPHIF